MGKSFKYVDTQNVALGGRADTYWKTQKHLKDVFSKLRKPAKVLPMALRDGRIADQQVLLQYFDLVGFEYGNWLNNNYRYNFLMGAVISLLDIMDVTGIRNPGFKKISLAFGARGKGKAAAHFEPGTYAINLTKEYGLSALAHEYGHALDYFFGTYIHQSTHDRSLSGGAQTAFSVVNKNRLSRKGTLRYLMKDLLKTIVLDENGAPSRYYSRCKSFAMGTYWESATEIFARTFEQYIQIELAKKNVVNKFLSQKKYEREVYLTPKELKPVIPKMKVLIHKMASYTK